MRRVELFHSSHAKCNGMVWMESEGEEREREQRWWVLCMDECDSSKGKFIWKISKGTRHPRDWWKLAASFWFFSENNKSMRIQSIHTITSIQLYSLMLSSIHTQLLHKQPSLSLSLYFLYYFIYSTCKLQLWPINKFLYLWWICFLCIIY